MTLPISDWLRPWSSASTIAARWPSGSSRTPASVWRISSRSSSSRNRSPEAAGSLAGRGLAAELDGRAAAAQDAQTLVARDREQPRAQDHRTLVGEQRAIGGREGDLQGFFGVGPGPEHVQAERQQFALVSLVQRLKRRRVIPPDRADQLLVCGEGVPGGRARRYGSNPGCQQTPLPRPRCGTKNLPLSRHNIKLKKNLHPPPTFFRGRRFMGRCRSTRQTDRALGGCGWPHRHRRLARASPTSSSTRVWWRR